MGQFTDGRGQLMVSWMVYKDKEDDARRNWGHQKQEANK